MSYRTDMEQRISDKIADVGEMIWGYGPFAFSDSDLPDQRTLTAWCAALHQELLWLADKVEALDNAAADR